MTRSVSPYDQRNDMFGFAVYSVVAFAPEGIQRKVQTVRQAVATRRSMMPAHITVKGTFCRINDLDGIIRIVAEIAARTGPVFVGFEGHANQSFPGADILHGFQGIDVTPELRALHMKLYEALTPITTLAYGPEGDSYHPHMTVYAEPSEGREQMAAQLAMALDMGAGFTAPSICLMGHAGRPYRGEWRLIHEFRLTGAGPDPDRGVTRR